MPETNDTMLRVVIVTKDGRHKICGLAPASVVDLCTKASFVDNLEVFGVPASLVRVTPRFVLYRELNVPTDLKRFDTNQL